MSPEYVVTLLRDKRGPRAVQTVRQYNTIMGFRPELLNFDMKAADLAFLQRLQQSSLSITGEGLF